MIERKSKFDIIAPFYDFMMKLFFLPLGGEKRFRQKILEFGCIESNQKILDVGSGTGTFSILASKYTTDGISVGLDISQQMLLIAEDKKYSPNIYFVLGNSLSMPFRSKLFDRVFLTYVLHELPAQDRRETLKEIRRILKPGGFLIATDLHLPRGKLKKQIFKAFMVMEEKEAWDFVFRGVHNEIESVGFRIEKEEFAVEDFVSMVMAEPLI